MAHQLQTAGWARPHSAVLAAGVVSALAGAALLVVGLAPMIGLGGETTAITSSIAEPIVKVGSSPGVAVPSAQTTGAGIASGVITDGPVNGVAFEMTVPRLGYRATVLEGVSAQVLDRAPGHYPDSAWPGRPGNVAIAAHNVYWLSFSRLHAGDQVEIRTRQGLYVYEVTGSKVVSPADRTVLAQTPEHRLTLTTCYPLWAGALATQRLVFFAREIGGVA